jgi:hypothetical protein
VLDGTGVSTIEAIGNAQNRGEAASHFLEVGIEALEVSVLRFRFGAPVIPRDVRNGDLLARIHPHQLCVLDEMI